jgi:hypothetical protein
MKKLLVAAAFAAMSFAAPTQAATLIINSDGKLTGAAGVTIGGTSYDVTFGDGTCAALFAGCDSGNDFTFNEQSSARLAAQALLDQVFIGSFDASAELTLGCSNTLTCQVFLPFSSDGGSNFLAITATNFSTGNGEDFLTFEGQVVNFDFQGAPVYTFARFTPSQAVAAAVPEPGTWAMMLLGFGAIGATMRRRRRVSAIAQMA